MDLDRQQYPHVYLLGIGGIGMSAVARYFQWEGRRVGGYDRTYTPLTSDLQREGIFVTYSEGPDAIPSRFLNPATTLIVYTPAIPPSHPQWQFFQEHGFRMVKRSDVLGWLSSRYPTVGIAGTHGKTSTSAWLGYLLDRLEIPILALVGGIMNNYRRNIILPPMGVEPRFFVVEADEYDRTFLKIRHRWAVINSLDPDHLDIYGTPAAFRAAFESFASATEKVVALAEHTISELGHIPKPAHITFGKGNGWDYSYRWMAPNVLAIDRGQKLWFTTRMPLPGNYNAQNLTGAVAILDQMLNVEDSHRLIKAIENYRGVWRRFSRIEGVPFEWIDDYAHLPAEIEAALSAMRSIYPHRKIVAVFHPHLYSRTRDFASDFAQALTKADEVWILPIYPARETPIPGVVSELIAHQMPTNFPCEVISKRELFRRLTQRPPQVLITLGAGDVDLMIPEVVRYYAQVKGNR